MVTASRTGEKAGPDPLWWVQDTAEYLQLPVATLYRWSSRREGPPAYRVGRHLRYDPAEVRAWLHAQTNRNPESAA